MGTSEDETEGAAVVVGPYAKRLLAGRLLKVSEKGERERPKVETKNSKGVSARVEISVTSRSIDSNRVGTIPSCNLSRDQRNFRDERREVLDGFPPD